METHWHKLKTLKETEPDERFIERSLASIIVMPQIHAKFSAHLWESFRYSVALGLGVLLIGTAIGGISYLKIGPQPLAGGLSAKSIAAEAANSDFSIQLAEAKYFEDEGAVVAMVLGEIAQNNLDHLSGAVLDQELRDAEDRAPEKSLFYDEIQ